MENYKTHLAAFISGVALGSSVTCFLLGHTISVLSRTYRDMAEQIAQNDNQLAMTKPKVFSSYQVTGDVR